MKTRALGRGGPVVGMLGLGCMGMSGAYGPAEDDESIATIHAAIDAGANLIDTGDYYGMGHNEMLIGRALRDRRREDVAISVKYGALRGPDGAWAGFDTRPAATKTWLAYTLQRLGTDYVDVYRPGRLDPSVPIEETVGGIAELIEAGYVRHIGLSEVGADTIKRAHATHPIADLQIEYSLLSRGLADSILPTTRELGMSITAYGVLSRGLLSGNWSRERSAGDRGFRAGAPRFQGENLDRNLELVETLRAVADEAGTTVSRLAIAWVAARGEDIVPVVGARNREQLADALAAAELELSPELTEKIEAAIPPGAAAGERYAAAGMASLDSER
jgi:aryl-alcohol dehydrogenase-like predicted oxidoreductase